MDYHVPVLKDEVVEALALEPGQTVLDATLGGGGHASFIASFIGSTGKLVGIDRDNDAINQAKSRLALMPDNQRPQLVLIRARYDLGLKAAVQEGVGSPDGILFDLGVSSHQLDDAQRGFTFRDPDAYLDMRMDQESDQPTAADLLNTLSEQQLARIFWDYSDERWSMRIAKFIIERRDNEPYRTAGQLVETVRAAIPAAARPKDIHPATRVFQALRIAVNEEYEALQNALLEAADMLAPYGRLVVISYHSGEDRIVKRTLAELSGKCSCDPRQPECSCRAKNPVLALVKRKPIEASDAEIEINPRARSAKMRVAEKLGAAIN